MISPQGDSDLGKARSGTIRRKLISIWPAFLPRPGNSFSTYRQARLGNLIRNITGSKVGRSAMLTARNSDQLLATRLNRADRWIKTQAVTVRIANRIPV